MAIMLKIDPEWNIIKKISNILDSDPVMIEQGRDFLEATKITAIELVENAFKYADPNPNEKHPIIFSFKEYKGVIYIRVTNYCSDEAQKKTIKDTIDNIHKGNAFNLFVARMDKILKEPDGFSRLGFYRISYETQYKLRYKFTSKTITVIGNRVLDKK
jgi:hypothetical protein